MILKTTKKKRWEDLNLQVDVSKQTVTKCKSLESVRLQLRKYSSRRKLSQQMFRPCALTGICDASSVCDVRLFHNRVNICRFQMRQIPRTIKVSFLPTFCVALFCFFHFFSVSGARFLYTKSRKLKVRTWHKRRGWRVDCANTYVHTLANMG